jgi:hypothetical protein
VSDENFLSRWSRLKRSGGEVPKPTASRPSSAAPAAVPTGVAAAAPAATPPVPPPLPPVETLEPGADISAFMRAEVDELLKRQALKKMLQDPRFNVMDGLDVYIDDYSQPDPLPAGWLEKMNQTVRLGEYREPEAGEEQAQAASPAAESAPSPEGAGGESVAAASDTSAEASTAPQPEESSRNV